MHAIDLLEKNVCGSIIVQIFRGQTKKKPSQLILLKYTLLALYKNSLTSLEVEPISKLWLNTLSVTLTPWTLEPQTLRLATTVAKKGILLRIAPNP